jgi:type IV pilus assembly protein PilO
MKLNFKKVFDFRNPKVRNIAAMAVLIVAVGALWYYKIIQVRNEKIGILREDLRKQEAELTTILALKPQLNQLKEDVRNNEKRLDSLKSIFPDQKEIPKLLMEITGIARATNILTVKFDPLPDVPREYYVENHYHLTVKGNYHSLANFYSFLANLPLIINLGKVVIRPNPSLQEQIKVHEEYGTDVQSIMASFQMTTFSSKK